MSEDRLQRSLNDYLDDRLDADERERFEQRLATDEELSRRLATAREIRAELRSGDEDLSPGFYTRTVARFAAERRRLPFGVRWSTAGLALATIAVAAIFVPSVLREEIPDMPLAPQAQEEGVRLPEESRTEKGERTAGDAESSLESIGHVPDERAPADQGKDDLLGRESIAAPEPRFKDDVGGLALEDRKRQAANEPAPPPAQKRSATTKSKPAATPPLAIAQQPSREALAEPVPEQLEEQSLGKGRASADEAADGLELNAKFKNAERVDASELDKAWDSDTATESDYFNLQRGAAPSAVELKVDLAGAGEIELLDARDARLQVVAGRKKENKAVADSTAPVPSAAANRFLAIGRRPGLDACATLMVRRTDKAWEITYDDSGSSVGAVSCGIEIPDDGVEIRFQGWPVGE